MKRASWDVKAMSGVQKKAGSDHKVKEETGGTDSTEQQRCQLILSQQGMEGEENTHPLARGWTQQKPKVN